MAMKVLPASSDLLLVRPHVVERGPGGRIDADLVGDLLVVIDDAVDVHGDRDLQHLAVDGDGLSDRFGKRGGRADLVEERADVLADVPCCFRSRKKSASAAMKRFGGVPATKRRRAGSRRRSRAGGGGVDGVAVRLELVDDGVERGHLAVVRPGMAERQLGGVRRKAARQASASAMPFSL